MPALYHSITQTRYTETCDNFDNPSPDLVATLRPPRNHPTLDYGLVYQISYSMFPCRNYKIWRQQVALDSCRITKCKRDLRVFGGGRRKALCLGHPKTICYSANVLWLVATTPNSYSFSLEVNPYGQDPEATKLLYFAGNNVIY